MPDGRKGPQAVAMKRIGIAVALLALVAVVAFYAYYDRHLRYFEETDDARIEADQVAVSSKLPGYVRSVDVSDNQTVARNAVLVTIDPQDYNTRVAAASADIAAARSAEAAAQASQKESAAGVDQARASLEAAQASLDFARREVRRYKPLVAAGAEPATRLSQLEADRDRAQAQLSAQQAALDQAQKRVESIGAQANQYRAQVAAAQVQRQAAANDLASTELKAPVGGKVANRTVRVGQFVQPGQRLMTIVPTQDLYVVANFKETQVGLMRPGQPVRIEVDALPGVDFKGVVESVTPGTGANFSLIKPDNATGNFTKIVQRVPVRIRIEAGPEARKVLVPGLSLVVEVDTRASKDDIDAIRREQDRSGQ
ncbi:MAG: HlyD family secretion protein [Novosphingobium sp.]|nr:HlyD family secretion protein [Novosphingobium sp.]